MTYVGKRPWADTWPVERPRGTNVPGVAAPFLRARSEVIQGGRTSWGRNSLLPLVRCKPKGPSLARRVTGSHPSFTGSLLAAEDGPRGQRCVGEVGRGGCDPPFLLWGRWLVLALPACWTGGPAPRLSFGLPWPSAQSLSLLLEPSLAVLKVDRAEVQPREYHFLVCERVSGNYVHKMRQELCPPRCPPPRGLCHRWSWPTALSPRA